MIKYKSLFRGRPAKDRVELKIFSEADGVTRLINYLFYYFLISELSSYLKDIISACFDLGTSIVLEISVVTTFY